MPTAEILAAWGPPVLSVVLAGGIGGFLKVMFDRKLTKATAGKTAIEGEVAQSADSRAWVEEARAEARAAREDAKNARADAESSRRSAWEAQDSAARCRTDNAAMQERMDDLEELIRSCARSGCPIRPLLPGRPNN